MADMREELDRHLAAAPDAGTDVEALVDSVGWKAIVRSAEMAPSATIVRALASYAETYSARLIAAAEARGAAEERGRVAKAIEAVTEDSHPEDLNGLEQAARIARTAPATDRAEAGEQR
jgi:hypothetical protein